MRIPAFSLMVCLCSLLILAGCQNMPPQPMGRGYSAYEEPYKSAPGKDAAPVGYPFSVKNNEAVMADINAAAKDLVEKLDAKISYSVSDIYLSMPEKNVFYNSFDYALRDEFTKHGYTLAASPARALSVEFVAYEPKSEKAKNAPADEYKMLYLGLATDVVKNVPGTLVGGIYDVPVFGAQPKTSLKLDTAGKMPCDYCTKDKGVCNKKAPCDSKQCEKCKKCHDSCKKPMTGAVPDDGGGEILPPIELKGEE